MRKLLHGYLLRWWRSSESVAGGRSLLALGRHAAKTGIHELLICRVGSVFPPRYITHRTAGTESRGANRSVAHS